jgi:hypothetical protein
MKFEEKLRRLGTCPVARRWVGDKGLETAWNSCDNWAWMDFLIWKLWRIKEIVPDHVYLPIMKITDDAEESFDASLIEYRNQEIADAIRKVITVNQVRYYLNKWGKESGEF